jgi:hypothetical protein
VQTWFPCLLASVALLATSCSSGDDTGGKPTACKRSDRTGTYQFTYFTQSGDCGDLPTEVARIESGNATVTGVAKCTTSNEKWSNNDCTFESTASCVTPEATSTGTGITHQETKSGSWLSGTSTIEVRKPNGTFVCRGTYKISASRQ